MIIKCSSCGKDVEAELHQIYPGTSDPVWVVSPCCAPEEDAEEIEWLTENIVDLAEAADLLADVVEENEELGRIYKDDIQQARSLSKECHTHVTKEVL